jgi:putative oxidoreductase
MEKMPKKPRLYWFAKIFISFFMLFSAYFTFSHPADFEQLGFPNYFRIELSIAKVVGALLLLIPAIPFRVRDWIYAGFIITMVSALIAHLHNHDPLSKILFVSIDLVLVTTSMWYVSKIEKSFTYYLPKR